VTWQDVNIQGTVMAWEIATCVLQAVRLQCGVGTSKIANLLIFLIMINFAIFPLYNGGTL
jgi:hypothetical protein